MNLIFRKNDSATSLLLFVYNNYLVLTHKDSIKLSSLLEYMRAFGKNDSAVRMALSRVVKAGLLINSKQDNEVFYSLTDEGKQAIALWNEGVMQYWKRYRLRNEPWNDKWHLLKLNHGFEQFDGYAEFSEKLKQLGYALINSNTWVSPYQRNKEVDQLIEKLGMWDYLIEMYGEMTIHRDLQRFLDEKFNIGRLRDLYRTYIETFSPQFTEYQKKSQEGHFIENGFSLPLLNQIGWNFFQIASNDFVLPRKLVSQWEQDEAVALFKQFREALIPHVQYFLNKHE